MNRRPRRTERRAGYTLIEVMMALGVLATAVVGIMAMQQATINGNQSAREITTATEIAQLWVNRLRRDSLNWTQSTNVATPTLLARTNYLNSGPPPAVGLGTWLIPDAVPALQENPGFDHYGNDTAVAANVRYCTALRLQWVYPGRALRTDIRVWWQQVGAPTRCEGGGPIPAENTIVVTVGDQPSRVYSVYATTIIRAQVPRAQ